ncbi:MAG: GyrI-like domain-containing protein [Chloroflexi bacterium]|nr:GyrI-like domain-containing protein [Chloroflexota bacterium]
MIKLDLRKELKYLYAPSAKKVEIVEVPRFQFAMIDGQIEAGEGPSTSASFQEALQALYGISYTLKFTAKLRKENPIDYPVMALEGLWWVKSGEFSFERKEDWLYTLMMLQPDFISAEMYAEALEQLRKKRGDNPSLAKMRLESFEEGLSMQIMHIGPYDDEPATIEKMDAFARENGYRPRGKHHEIYLSDPRRAEPARLKTVLRHPIEKM